MSPDDCALLYGLRLLITYTHSLTMARCLTVNRPLFPTTTGMYTRARALDRILMPSDPGVTLFPTHEPRQKSTAASYTHRLRSYALTRPSMPYLS